MTGPLHPVIHRYYESYNARRFQEGADLFAPDALIDVELLATGTHRGPLDLGSYGQFEPTGVEVHVRHREVLEIRDGAAARPDAQQPLKMTKGPVLLPGPFVFERRLVASSSAEVIDLLSW
jgi:hypothetical protein